MDQFSISLKLSESDLTEDFLKASQTCIVGGTLDTKATATPPLAGSRNLKTPSTPPTSDSNSIPIKRKLGLLSDGTTRAVIRETGPAEPEPGKRVQIALADCLACSGCITSAESVLVAQSNSGILKEVLAANNSELDHTSSYRPISLSFSIQSLLSLFQHFYLCMLAQEDQNGITLPPGFRALVQESITQQASTRDDDKQTTKELARVYNSFLCMLAAFIKTKLRIDYVFDLGIARDISLMLNSQYFVSQRLTLGIPSKGVRGPIFSSTCPGFVNFAQKKMAAVSADLLANVSQSKSPQSIQGYLLRDVLEPRVASRQRDEDSSTARPRFFNVAVMPCYDKKLEAIANNKVIEEKGVGRPDIDLVLSTSELLNLLEEFRYTEFLHTRLMAAGPPSQCCSFDRLEDLLLQSLPEADVELEPAAVQDVFMPISQFEEAHADLPFIKTAGNYLMMAIYDTINYYHRQYQFKPTGTFPQTTAGDFAYTLKANPSKTQSVQSFTLTIGPASFHYAYMFGFKNIQNLYLNLKRNFPLSSPTKPASAALSATHDALHLRNFMNFAFLEMNACPRGCLDGIAQIKPSALTASLSDPNFLHQLQRAMERLYLDVYSSLYNQRKSTELLARLTRHDALHHDKMSTYYKPIESDLEKLRKNNAPSIYNINW